MTREETSRIYDAIKYNDFKDYIQRSIYGEIKQVEMLLDYPMPSARVTYIDANDEECVKEIYASIGTFEADGVYNKPTIDFI